MWLGEDAQGDAWVEDDGERDPDGLDAPPYALADEVRRPGRGRGRWPGTSGPTTSGPTTSGSTRSEEDEAPGRRILLPAFALGAVVGMLLLGLVWGATAMFGGSDAPADRAPTGGTNRDPQQAAATSAAPAGPTRLERCRRPTPT